jgi:acylphosphatase
LSDLILHVVARGMVQGVGYRAFVADEAARHGVVGWVRNRRDGSVEAVFNGPAAAVEATVSACRKGPWGARVDGIDRRQATADELNLRRPGDQFSVLPTA